MAKSASAPYLAGRRGASWLKIKSVHSLDLVVLGAEWGSGRRKGFLSICTSGRVIPITVATSCWGRRSKDSRTRCWRAKPRAPRARGAAGFLHGVRGPELVVEITFNDVQTSPQYPGGVALRFARVRSYRPDKVAGDADTIEQVKALHAMARE